MVRFPFGPRPLEGVDEHAVLGVPAAMVGGVVAGRGIRTRGDSRKLPELVVEDAVLEYLRQRS